MPITTVTLSEGHGPGERSPSRIRSVWKSATRVPVAPRWRTLTRRVSSRAYSHATAILIGATSTATPAPARGRSAWVSVGLCPQTAMTETTTMLQDVTAGHRCRSAHARCMDAQSIVAAEDHANPGAEHAWIWGRLIAAPRASEAPGYAQAIGHGLAVRVDEYGLKQSYG